MHTTEHDDDDSWRSSESDTNALRSWNTPFIFCIPSQPSTQYNFVNGNVAATRRTCRTCIPLLRNTSIPSIMQISPQAQYAQLHASRIETQRKSNKNCNAKWMHRTERVNERRRQRRQRRRWQHNTSIHKNIDIFIIQRAY